MSFATSAPACLGLLLTSLVAVSGCATSASAEAADELAPAQESASIVTAGTLRVGGVKAERLLNAFGLVDAVDHAMGGRASVDVKQIEVLTSSNGALDDSDPLFLVPMTSATFDNVAEMSSHRQTKDEPQVAAVLFGAIAAVDASLSDSAMGRTFVTASKVECSGHGPAAGDDPKSPPPMTATCAVTSESGRTFRVSGAKALRILQGFGLAGAVEHAMGGHFGVSATDVSCERRSNTALEETSPLFALPLHSCSARLDASGGGALSVADTTPRAFALRKALEAAGLPADSAMGKTGVGSAHVTCSKGPGSPTSCSLAR